jgi:hypothetical protein
MSKLLLRTLIFATFVCGVAHAQSNLADNIDVSRTIIAKLDRATQNDPPPNFASSILVRVHKEATTFIGLADALSEQIRKGGSPDATSMFSLYSQFIDLYDQYELFVNVTTTRQIELATVQTTSMGKEFFETKTFLEAATYAELMRIDDALQACHSSHPLKP